MLVAARDRPSVSAARGEPAGINDGRKNPSVFKAIHRVDLDCQYSLTIYFADRSISIGFAAIGQLYRWGIHMEEARMPKFVVAPHFRLQEWVAEEKGLFRRRRSRLRISRDHGFEHGSGHHLGNQVGAYQTLEAGRTCNVSGACHWTMNVAASNGHGKLYADCYSVSPCGVFVPPDLPIKAPADLAGVPISVGYQSGSHYATIQGLEQYLKPEEIKLSFNDGMLFSRMEMLIDGKVPAASLFSGPYYFLEQLGFRKVIDTTFMMASMVTGTPDPEDVRKYFRALRRAQRDIDLRPELYTHYYKKEFPVRFHDADGHAALGPGRAAGVRAIFEADI